MTLRIGILGEGFIGWGGGLDFLRMVCGSLHAADPTLELHLLLPLRGPRASTRRMVHRARAVVARLRGRTTQGMFAPAIQHILEAVADTGGSVQVHYIDSGDAALSRSMRLLGLDAVLPAVGPLALPGSQRWVGYLYDFQHRRLPHLFSQDEVARRDIAFGNMLDKAKVVIVNARAVADDAREFFPKAHARIVALPFSAAPRPSWFDLDVAAAQQRHGLSAPYFIVCNQFWIHKDHRTAIEAFAIVAKTDSNVLLVCTGATSDYRNPNHLDELMHLAEERCVRDRVRVLGLIPKLDQIALVRGARALLQPTLFEGGPGGGAVYDAVSLGVPSLVSDIAVNREIDDRSVTFFRVGDAIDLAQLMLLASQGRQLPSLDDEQLIAAGRARRRECGIALLNAIELARG